MFAKKLLIFVAALAVTTMACGLTVDIPISTEIKTGPTVKEDILVPDLGTDDKPLIVEVNFGAGELSIDSGADALIEGTAIYNVEDFSPEIKKTDRKVEISTGNLDIDGFPKFVSRIVNEWELHLSDRPMDLSVFAGAYKGDLELGGLSLSNLRIADGAAEVNVNFAEPNQVEMGSFRYDTGASSVTLSNLGNANFRSLTFQGGAGSYELDFSGDLQDDASVLIQTGLSELTISVPDDLDVRVQVDSGLANINTLGYWAQSGSTYTHKGDGPALDISIELAAGNLRLESH